MGERTVALLSEEYAAHDEVHMRTLAAWVQEYNTLVNDIGRHVIERAQGYYDARALWQQVVQEYARQQEEVDQIKIELERAVKNLNKAEAAFESFIMGGKADMSDAEWEKLAPLPAEWLTNDTVANDAKLLRTFRISMLADRVTSLQRQRDSASLEMDAKCRELEDVRRRFEQEDLQHSVCTWNCSVKRSAPFYEKRRMHEHTVDGQLQVLHHVEQRLQQARHRVAAINCGGTVGRAMSWRSRQADEMSHQSFEIAGAEPGEDEFEFVSCQGSDTASDRDAP